MPIGIIINVGSVFFGGLIGSLLGKWIPIRLKVNLPKIFGLAAISMGIVKLIDLTNLSIVILSLILGTVIGELLNIDVYLDKFAHLAIDKFQKTNEKDNTEYFVLALLAFAFSGTAIFGALNEGFMGDSSILLSKSVLDFFTAVIFSSIVGFSISLISIPQIIFLLLIYACANLISPFMTEYVLGNFISIGGIITMMIGMHMAKIVDIKVANVIPSIFVVVLLSIL